jgi:hypothetical protein
MPDGPGPIGDLADEGEPQEEVDPQGDEEDGWQDDASERSQDFDEGLSYHSEGQDPDY